MVGVEFKFEVIVPNSDISTGTLLQISKGQLRLQFLTKLRDSYIYRFTNIHSVNWAYVGLIRLRLSNIIIQ